MQAARKVKVLTEQLSIAEALSNEPLKAMRGPTGEGAREAAS